LVRSSVLTHSGCRKRLFPLNKFAVTSCCAPSQSPAAHTLNDVINGLDAELFKTCFANWVEALSEHAPDIIAIDGKTPRRTHARRKGREPLHLVSAWAARQRLALRREAVNEKSNEIVAIPLLLERLELTGRWLPSTPWGSKPTLRKRSLRVTPTITLEAKAWLASLACRNAKELGYPTSCGRRDFWRVMRASTDRRRATPAFPIWRKVRCQSACKFDPVLPQEGMLSSEADWTRAEC
jgi:hypothetical protein